MSIEGDIKHIERNLVKTIDRKVLIEMLENWREESTDKGERTAFTDILSEIRSGSLDG